MKRRDAEPLPRDLFFRALSSAEIFRPIENFRARAKFQRAQSYMVLLDDKGSMQKFALP